MTVFELGDVVVDLNRDQRSGVVVDLRHDAAPQVVVQLGFGGTPAFGEASQGSATTPLGGLLGHREGNLPRD